MKQLPKTSELPDLGVFSQTQEARKASGPTNTTKTRETQETAKFSHFLKIMKRGAGGLGGSEALSRSARESAWGRRALYGSLVYGWCLPSPGPRES